MIYATRLKYTLVKSPLCSHEQVQNGMIALIMNTVILMMMTPYVTGS
jgi:hypothetical protein